jgi:hypothetical protein
MKSKCLIIVACALLAGIFAIPASQAGSSGVSDPTVTVAEFTPSGGKDFKDQVHASLDSLDTAVEAVIDVADGLVSGTTEVSAPTVAYVNKTASYTNSTEAVVSYNTTAVTTNYLPEASTVLGKVYKICLQDDDGDLVVVTDGTDTFDGTNTKVTMADAADSLHVVATSANVYTILVNVGGTLGTL